MIHKAGTAYGATVSSFAFAFPNGATPEGCHEFLARLESTTPVPRRICPFGCDLMQATFEGLDVTMNWGGTGGAELMMGSFHFVLWVLNLAGGRH